ncbi:hypothetical protein PMAYCL1PPCAC_14278, partial [Pristionchus mayeri]
FCSSAVHSPSLHRVRIPLSAVDQIARDPIGRLLHFRVHGFESLHECHHLAERERIVGGHLSTICIMSQKTSRFEAWKLLSSWCTAYRDYGRTCRD